MKKAVIIHLLDITNIKIHILIKKLLMRGFKSKDHEIFTYETDKRSLSDFDDKRYYG